MYNISVYIRYISKQQDENHRQSTNVYTYNRFHCYFSVKSAVCQHRHVNSIPCMVV